MACDKKDSEQPAVSSQVLANKSVIEDQIESKDLEYVNCDGKMIAELHGPVRKLEKSFEIAAPSYLIEPVKYVSIQNFRTCATQVFDVSEKTFSEFSSLDSTGKISVAVSDENMKMGIRLNVHDGANVLKIRYFGKCLKQKSEKDSAAKEDSYKNCAEG